MFSKLFQSNFEWKAMLGENFSLSTSSSFLPLWLCQYFPSVLKYMLAVLWISSSLHFSVGWLCRIHLSVHWMRKFVNLLLASPGLPPLQHSKTLDWLENMLFRTNQGWKGHWDYLEWVACTYVAGHSDLLDVWSSPHSEVPNKGIGTPPKPSPM